MMLYLSSMINQYKGSPTDESRNLTYYMYSIIMSFKENKWSGRILICFVLPIILNTILCELLRKIGWLKEENLMLE